MDIVNLIFGILAIILALVCLVVGGMLVFRSMRNHGRNLNASMNEDLEIVRVRQDNKSDGAGAQNPEAWKEEVAAMEQFLVTLARLSDRKAGFFSGKPHFTFEVTNPSGSEEILFYVSVPKKYRSALEKQVHSYFPTAEIEKVDDYTIFAPGSEVAVGTLKLKDSHALPLTIYEEMTSDSLSEITTALSKLETASEGACIQFVLRGADKGWNTKGRTIAREMQQGKRLRQVHKGGALVTAGAGTASFMGDLAGGLLGAKKDPAKSTGDAEIVQLTPEEHDLIKAMEAKSAKPGFHVNIRLIASAESAERAQEILAHMENAFSQFERYGVNQLAVKHYTLGEKDVVFNYIFRLFKKSQSSIFGTAEIASMFHFPISTTETPKITWLKSGSAPPPVNVPLEGMLLGYNNYRGSETPIRISEGDRRRHLYVIGQTGTGKSTFLQEMAKQDVRDGAGLCFIDPHGDAIEDIMSAIPKERAEDVIFFDPSNAERSFGLNMMEYEKPEEKTFVINEMINIFDKLYDLKSTGGPMFEQYMRNAMLLVMEDPESGSTLMEIPKVLSDEEFRAMKLTKCKNMVVKEFWEKEAQKAGGEAALANMVPYITSKLTPFLTNDMMRPIISQQKSTIDFRDAMDSQKILLISLSKGKIGELNSHLLGMIIVGKLLMAALSRTDIVESERKDFFLYIDEFQNVTTDSIAQILSEARKYRLALVIAHQFIGQLSDDISKAVFGNVGSMAAFRVGPEDAEFLQKQFDPVFDAQDLINIDNYKCVTRVLMNNKTVAPFNISTYPPSAGSTDLVPALKELSQLKYARDRLLVEQEVSRRSYVAPKKKEARGKDLWK